MKLYSKQTDEEYIEATRKTLGRSRYFGLFHILGTIIYLVMFQVLMNMVYSLDGAMDKLISPGIHIGIMLGVLGGVLIVFAGANMIWAVQYFKGHRTERMMIKFYDAMKSNTDTSNHTPDGIRQPADGSPKPSL